jgi:hypothetical protein
MGRCQLGSFLADLGPVAGPRVHSNEPFGSLKCITG